MKKKVGLIVIAAIIFVAMFTGCVEEEGPTPTTVPTSSPPPPTPVTPGYVQSYDHKLGYGFEYPADWEMQVPGFEPPYENVEVFTKKGEPTRIVISVKSTDLKSLAGVKAFGYISRDSILEEEFVDVNDREAYEVIFEQYPDKKAKWVIFLANDREHKIECSTTEALCNEYEEIFDHVINSFIMMPEADMK